MERIFCLVQSLFYNFGRYMVFGKILKDEFKEFILEKFKEMGIEVRENIVDMVFELIGGYFYYI